MLFYAVVRCATALTRDDGDDELAVAGDLTIVARAQTHNTQVRRCRNGCFPGFLFPRK